MSKFAILSHSLPPSPTGQAIMIYRLLSGLSPNQYLLLSKMKYEKSKNDFGLHNWLPAEYHWVGSDENFPTSRKKLLRGIGKLIENVLVFTKRIYSIFKEIRKNKIYLLIGCSGAALDIVGGFFASKLAGIKFVAYIFDDFVYQWSNNRRRIIVKLLAPFLFKHCDGVIVPNEFLQDEYRKRYGINPILIHNPNDKITQNINNIWPSEQGKIKIVYTGSIYDAHYDAFKNLLSAIGVMGSNQIELHLYTPQSRQSLEEHGITGTYKVFPFTQASRIIEIQKEADILFLPLAFDSPYPEVIRTSAPGKMGEYLASGRPILVHCPANSYISWYFQKWNTGVVVDQPEPKLLADALKKIILHPEFRDKICQNAQQRARLDFELTAMQERFFEVIMNPNIL